MDINLALEEFIDQRAHFVFCSRLNELEERICSSISKPDYQSFGKFLTPTQAANYVGCKSVNGMKSLIQPFGIKPIKCNSKAVRYDRDDLNKVNVSIAFDDYKKSL